MIDGGGEQDFMDLVWCKLGTRLDIDYDGSVVTVTKLPPLKVKR